MVLLSRIILLFLSAQKVPAAYRYEVPRTPRQRHHFLEFSKQNKPVQGMVGDRNQINIMELNQAGLDIAEVQKYVGFRLEEDNKVLNVSSWLVEAFLPSSISCSVVDEDDDSSTSTLQFVNQITIDEVVDCIIAFFFVTKWYDILIADGIKTPYSTFVPLRDVFPSGSVADITILEQHISQMPNGDAFV